jgi:peptidoglycan/LPS O-acetylase OafA/YrhL
MGTIRLLLALFVIVTHTESFFGFKFTGGQVAVELFFIISGFYMTMILNEKYVGEGSYAIFIKNRFLKIYPIYWVVLFITVLSSTVFYLLLDNRAFAFNFYMEYGSLLELKTFIFLVFSNIFIFGQDIIMFLGVNTEGQLFFTSDFWQTNPPLWQSLFIQQAWTLGIELTFYLIAPFIVRRSTWVIFGVIVFSLLIRFFIYDYLELTNDPWRHRFFLSELSLFLFGTLAYRLYKFFPLKNRTILGTIFLIILANLLFYEFIYQDLELLNNWYLYTLFTLSLGYIFQLFKDNEWDNLIGEFSYPVYTSHIFVIAVVYVVLSKFGLEEYLSEVTFIVALIFSYLLIKFIMNPIEKIRRKNIKRAFHG